MANIGGNISGTIQTQSGVVVNAIGEAESTWQNAFTVRGWLGMQSGENRYNTFNTKLEESSHVFLMDYHSGVYGLADQNTRMILKNVLYDVLYIDNPDEMNEQLEIHLRRVGAWNG